MSSDPFRNIALPSAMALLLLGSSAMANLVTFTPDSLADFQANGTIVSQVDGGFAASVISDPTTETPNVLRVANNITEGGQVAYTHDLIGVTFNPSTQGAISSLDFSIEIRDPNVSLNDTAIDLGLRQNDSIYFFTENGTSRFRFRNANSTTFLSFSKSGLEASDFGFFAGGTISSLDDSLNPDFSASGGLIQFLYGTASGTNASVDHPTRTSDIRNSVLTINHAAVPEPSSFLVLFGVAAFVMARYRSVRTIC